jgi:hypothetical protein
MISLVGCASKSIDPTSSDFRSRLAEENHQLHTSLTKAHFDFLHMTKEQYFELLAKEDKNLVNEIKNFDEVILGTSPAAFVICMKSVKAGISICDNGYTAQLDRVKMNKDINLTKLMDEIRGP